MHPRTLIAATRGSRDDRARKLGSNLTAVSGLLALARLALLALGLFRGSALIRYGGSRSSLGLAKIVCNDLASLSSVA
jgi:hypothetical protein